MRKNSLLFALIILPISIFLAWGMSNAIDDDKFKDNNASEVIRPPSCCRILLSGNGIRTAQYGNGNAEQRPRNVA